MADAFQFKLGEKRRFTVSVPGHVADAIEQHAKLVSATPTEYAADILRFWFGRGCPPLSEEEEVLRDVRQETGEDVRSKKKPKVSD